MFMISKALFIILMNWISALYLSSFFMPSAFATDWLRTYTKFRFTCMRKCQYIHGLTTPHTTLAGIALKQSGNSIESVQPRPHPSNFTKTFILLDCQFQSSYNLKSWLIIIIKCIKLLVAVVLILTKSCPNLTPAWMWNVIRCHIDIPTYIFSTVLSKSLRTCSYLSSK